MYVLDKWANVTSVVVAHAFRKPNGKWRKCSNVDNVAVSPQNVSFVKNVLHSFVCNADNNRINLSVTYSNSLRLFSGPLQGFFSPFN